MLVHYDVTIQGNVKVLGSTGTTRNVNIPARSQTQQQDIARQVFPDGDPYKDGKGGGEVRPTDPGGRGPDPRLSISFTVLCPCDSAEPEAAQSTGTSAAADTSAVNH